MVVREDMCNVHFRTSGTSTESIIPESELRGLGVLLPIILRGSYYLGVQIRGPLCS